MFDLPDPVSMFEKAKNAGLERELALDWVNVAYSSALNLLYGLRKFPFIGPGFEEMAYGTVAALKNTKEFQDGKLKLTIRQELWNPDRLTLYSGGWITKSSTGPRPVG